MDLIDSRESDSDADLEYGEITRGDDQIKGRSCNGWHSKEMVDREWSVVGGLNESIKGDDGLSTSMNVLNSSENVEILVDEVREEVAGLVKKKTVEEKWKLSSKKPPKPPRPPGALPLDEADVKLAREISQRSRLKNARIEQMKALKKKRADKSSSSMISIFAMAITLLFCCVIIFHVSWVRIYDANTCVRHQNALNGFPYSSVPRLF